jgi:hypothetical protein
MNATCTPSNVLQAGSIKPRSIGPNSGQQSHHRHSVAHRPRTRGQATCGTTIQSSNDGALRSPALLILRHRRPQMTPNTAWEPLGPCQRFSPCTFSTQWRINPTPVVFIALTPTALMTALVIDMLHLGRLISSLLHRYMGITVDTARQE